MAIVVPENVQKWFLDQKLEVPLYPENTVKRFRSLKSLYDFLEKEIGYWQPFDQQISQRFNTALTNINNAIANATNESNFQNYLNQTLSILKNPVWNEGQGQCIVYSDTELGKELKVVSEKYNEDGYRAFFMGVLFQRVRAGQFGNRFKDEYFGLFDAYIYQRLKEHLGEQLGNAETSLSEIQSKFNVFFDECEQQQNEQLDSFDTFVKNHDSWKEQSADALEGQIKAFDTALSSQQVEHRTIFDTDALTWKARVKEQEDLYQNKLMLEAPVEYWKQLEAKHKTTGMWFAIATAVTVVALVLILGGVLYNWPPLWIEEGKWNLNTLKGSFLLLTITSLALYVVHFLAKFSVSSYHLARDAEERKQLTYVYLSLLQKNAVSAEQQEIILTALFSRADTGLLKGGSSPTMPVAAQLMGMFKG